MRNYFETPRTAFTNLPGYIGFHPTEMIVLINHLRPLTDSDTPITDTGVCWLPLSPTHNELEALYEFLPKHGHTYILVITRRPLHNTTLAALHQLANFCTNRHRRLAGIWKIDRIAAGHQFTALTSSKTPEIKLADLATSNGIIGDLATAPATLDHTMQVGRAIAHTFTQAIDAVDQAHFHNPTTFSHINQAEVEQLRKFFDTYEMLPKQQAYQELYTITELFIHRLHQHCTATGNTDWVDAPNGEHPDPALQPRWDTIPTLDTTIFDHNDEAEYRRLIDRLRNLNGPQLHGVSKDVLVIAAAMMSNTKTRDSILSFAVEPNTASLVRQLALATAQATSGSQRFAALGVYAACQFGLHQDIDAQLTLHYILHHQPTNRLASLLLRLNNVCGAAPVRKACGIVRETITHP
ncbi:DUF4192 family protein [Corynebacterium choanae]|uniref:DUF4192 domain-containing protein n=1 Tax=Corynebacterium choanae TaxID=1862358 RepID=A0A3G6J6Q3_9CORY|nr:DUF4192 family protein [Corynebacterium choanae]AZA13747.1 hypothetical protein CCHOA_06775 [Corynebacterium choanae]